MAKHILSCGTLVVNPRRQLLCHVTHTPRWDIPKGMLDPGETELEAAMRELRSLAHLHCSTTFRHHVTGVPTPEMDGYRWAARSEVPALCWPRMGEVLKSIDW